MLFRFCFRLQFTSIWFFFLFSSNKMLDICQEEMFLPSVGVSMNNKLVYYRTCVAVCNDVNRIEAFETKVFLFQLQYTHIHSRHTYKYLRFELVYGISYLLFILLRSANCERTCFTFHSNSNIVFLLPQLLQCCYRMVWCKSLANCFYFSLEKQLKYIAGEINKWNFIKWNWKIPIKCKLNSGNQWFKRNAKNINSSFNRAIEILLFIVSLS